MAKAPTVIGVLTEPPAPTWWKVNRHKVFGISGLLIGYLIGTHLHGAPSNSRRRPSQATPRPRRRPQSTPRARPTASPHNPAAPPAAPRRHQHDVDGAQRCPRRLEEPLVLIPRPRRRIGRPRPQRPGLRYPHRPDRLPGAWSR
uniref:hypothetical protein n=1 Tax=Streptomyces sp. NBC_00998 TaxID=2903712 RepID=UPI002F9180B5|nr:hypothetical protein OG513_38965 [Streptomyces sp. NBC_00998]